MSGEKVFNCGLWYDGELHKGVYFANAEHNALYANGEATQDGASYREIWKPMDYTMKVAHKAYEPDPDGVQGTGFGYHVYGTGNGAALCPDGVWRTVKLSPDIPMYVGRENLYTDGEITFYFTPVQAAIQVEERSKGAAEKYPERFYQTAIGNVGWTYTYKDHQDNDKSYWRYTSENTYGYGTRFSVGGIEVSEYLRSQYTEEMKGEFDRTTDFTWGDTAFVIKPPEKIEDSIVLDGVTLDRAFMRTLLTKIPVREIEKINAQTEIFGMNNTFEYTPITEIPAGCLAGLRAVAWNETFAYCHKLKELPEQFIGGTLGTRNGAFFHGTFMECHGLEKLPNRIYKRGTVTEPFGADCMFFNCKALKNLPATLFEGCEGVLGDAKRMFMGAFDPAANIHVPGTLLQPLASAVEKNAYCIAGMFAYSGIKTVDADLLKPFVGKDVALQPHGTTFGLFSRSGITSVPQGFCDGIAVKSRRVSGDDNFSKMFGGCENLRTVPSNIFDRLDWTGFSYGSMSMFEWTFRDCKNLRTLPPLWEKFGTRTEERHGIYYAKATMTFYGCRNASNYAACPNWCKYEGVSQSPYGYCRITKEEYDRINRLNEANQKA